MPRLMMLTSARQPDCRAARVDAAPDFADTRVPNPEMPDADATDASPAA